MARLGCIGLICIAVCAGAVTLARRIGGMRVSPLAAIFTMPDGTPCPEVCFFGVQPGKTSYQEAVLLVQKHPFTRLLHRNGRSNDRFSIFQSTDASFDVEFAKSLDGDELAWIGLTNANFGVKQASSGAGYLGDMIDLLGPPTGVGVSDSDLLTYAYYNADRIELSAVHDSNDDSDPISMNDPVYSVQLYAPDQRADMAGGTADIGAAQFKLWRGFRVIGLYRYAPPIDMAP